MNIQPRGPNGIEQRIQEIRQRMDEKLGRSPASEAPTQVPIDFKGEISGHFDSNNLRPYNPFAQGTTLAPGELPGMIQKAATEAGIDPALFDALIATESAYDPNARSRAGALGLSQLMPATAQSLGIINPLDPTQNLRGGATYLSQLLQKFNGDQRLALAAYNAGPGAVGKFGGIPPYKETQSYVERVLGLFEARKNR